MSLQRRQSLVGIAFVLPAVVFFAIFNFYAIGYALYLSFTSWDLLTPPRWIGLANYTAFQRAEFPVVAGYHASLHLRGRCPVDSTVARAGAASEPARPLQRALPGHLLRPGGDPGGCRRHHLGAAVPAERCGEQRRGCFGVSPLPWLASAQYALHAIVIVSVWGGFGYATLILLAGLQSIPPEYGEAAAIDGASRWRIVKDITLPLLAPRLLFVTATSVAALLTSFVVPFVMTNGGPGTATRVLPLLIYQTGFQFLHAGQASAMAFILLLITLVFTAVQFRLFGREVL